MVPESDAQSILERYSSLASSWTDAFNLRPVPAGPSLLEPELPFDLSGQQDSEIGKQICRLQFITHAFQHPHFEDEDRSNSLHWLASVVLSKSNIESHDHLSRQHTAPDQRGPEYGDPLDSSHDKMHLRLSLAENLLHSGINSNHYDRWRNTPLMAFAAQLPEVDDYETGPQILDLLIKHGANIHWRNRSGETALLVAARCGKKLAVRTLIENGANVHVRDASGRGVLALLYDKMEFAQGDLIQYVHYEACQAYLSGSRGNACEEPTLIISGELTLHRLRVLRMEAASWEAKV